MTDNSITIYFASNKWQCVKGTLSMHYTDKDGIKSRRGELKIKIKKLTLKSTF